jgi:hypothetical protein
LLPAAAFLILEDIDKDKIVGLPVDGSQSAKYSIKPNEAPATEDGYLFEDV